MTNEEMARECASGRCGDAYDASKAACLEMAEWKDQQFKEYLEKFRTRFVGYNSLPVWNAIQEIINELFNNK